MHPVPPLPSVEREEAAPPPARFRVHRRRVQEFDPVSLAVRRGLIRGPPCCGLAAGALGICRRRSLGVVEPHSAVASTARASMFGEDASPISLLATQCLGAFGVEFGHR